MLKGKHKPVDSQGKKGKTTLTVPSGLCDPLDHSSDASFISMDPGDLDEKFVA